MTVNENQVCGGGVKGEDSCNGDSGGPLMVVKEGDMPRWFVIGIVSYGALSCGGDKVPAIYTRVSAYLPWILDKIVEKPGGPGGSANSTDDLYYTKQKLALSKNVQIPHTNNIPYAAMKKQTAVKKQTDKPKKQQQKSQPSSKSYKW